MNEFDEFDFIDVPDQWAEILGRVETPGRAASAPDDLTQGRSRQRNRMWALLGAAAAVAAVVIGLMAIDRTPDDVVVTRATQPPRVQPDAADSTPPAATARTTTARTTTLLTTTLECDSRASLVEIGDLVRSGQPAYDYSPARDVAELVEKSGVVVTGTIRSLQRVQGGLETYTLFDVADIEVLAGSGDVDTFVTSSSWPFLDEPDPLSERRALDDVQFVAFLLPLDLNSAPSRWQPDVEGLAFACDGRTAQSLVGLPPDAAGLTVQGIVDLVSSPVGGEGLARPVLPPEVCTATSARGDGVARTGEISYFARPSENPIAIQIIGTDETTPAEPFAWVQRSFGDDRDTRELRVFDNGNGEASWDVGDGSQGYIRTRGLDEAAVEEILDSLVPLPSDAEFPGFRVASEWWQSLHEGMNTALTGIGARSDCQVPEEEPETIGATLRYSVFAVSGDPIVQYGAVIDRPVPLDVHMAGSTVIIVSGTADPAAPTAAQVIDADVVEWENLLTQLDAEEIRAAGEASPLSATIELETDAVAPGERFVATLVVVNAGPTVQLTVDGCRPKWTIVLAGGPAPQVFDWGCDARPLTLGPGVTRLPVELSASFSECMPAPEARSEFATCPVSPGTPPLDPGMYVAVIVGEIPGVPEPEPVLVTVTS